MTVAALRSSAAALFFGDEVVTTVNPSRAAYCIATPPTAEEPPYMSIFLPLCGVWSGAIRPSPIATPGAPTTVARPAIVPAASSKDVLARSLDMFVTFATTLRW